MEYLYRPTRTLLNQQATKGAVLVITLLFLLVITLLVLNILETSLLQTKMQQNYNDKIISLQNAETALRLAKNQIINGTYKGEAINNDWCYQFQPNQNNFCQKMNCYAITATGKKNHAVTTLQNIYVIESLQQPDGTKKVKKYSLVWSEK